MEKQTREEPRIVAAAERQMRNWELIQNWPIGCPRAGARGWHSAARPVCAIAREAGGRRCRDCGNW